MSEEVINDLKQFILAAINQAVSDLPTREELEKRFEQMHRKFDHMEHRFEVIDWRFKQMDLRFDDLELKVDTIADAHAIMLEEHDLAISHLQAVL